jgi:hypothetical protein
MDKGDGKTGSVSYLERPKVSAKLQIEKRSSGEQEGYFVLDPESPSWAVLNAEGVAVLRLCDGQRTVTDISKRIAQGRGAKAEEIQPEVNTFLQQMAAARLLGNDSGLSTDELPEKNRFHSLALEVSRACNLECDHCHLAAGE